MRSLFFLFTLQYHKEAQHAESFFSRTPTFHARRAVGIRTGLPHHWAAILALWSSHCQAGIGRISCGAHTLAETREHCFPAQRRVPVHSGETVSDISKARLCTWHPAILIRAWPFPATLSGCGQSCKVATNVESRQKRRHAKRIGQTPSLTP